MRREIKADIKKQHDLYVNNLYDDVDRQGIPSLKKRDGNGDAELDSIGSGTNWSFECDAFTKTGYNEVLPDMRVM